MITDLHSVAKSHLDTLNYISDRFNNDESHTLTMRTNCYWSLHYLLRYLFSDRDEADDWKFSTLVVEAESLLADRVDISYIVENVHTISTWYEASNEDNLSLDMPKLKSVIDDLYTAILKYKNSPTLPESLKPLIVSQLHRRDILNNFKESFKVPQLFKRGVLKDIGKYREQALDSTIAYLVCVRSWLGIDEVNASEKKRELIFNLLQQLYIKVYDKDDSEIFKDTLEYVYGVSVQTYYLRVVNVIDELVDKALRNRNVNETVTELRYLADWCYANASKELRDQGYAVVVDELYNTGIDVCTIHGHTLNELTDVKFKLIEKLNDKLYGEFYISGDTALNLWYPEHTACSNELVINVYHDKFADKLFYAIRMLCHELYSENSIASFTVFGNLSEQLFIIECHNGEKLDVTISCPETPYTCNILHPDLGCVYVSPLEHILYDNIAKFWYISDPGEPLFKLYSNIHFILCNTSINVDLMKSYKVPKKYKLCSTGKAAFNANKICIMQYIGCDVTFDTMYVGIKTLPPKYSEPLDIIEQIMSGKDITPELLESHSKRGTL